VLYLISNVQVHDGDCATYIPILAEANPEWFSVSICTVDGQQFSFGDTDVNFSIQSCVKPLMYAVAVEDRGRLHKS
jgi:glutaminase